MYARCACARQLFGLLTRSTFQNQPGGAWIGKTVYAWPDAVAKYGSSGFCVTWVQVSLYNQHFGEGGQAPVCSSTCGK